MKRVGPVKSNVLECQSLEYPGWVVKLLALLGPTVRVSDMAILFGKPLTARRTLCGADDTSLPPLQHALRNTLELFTKQAGKHRLDGKCAAKVLAGQLKARQVGQFWLTINTWLISWGAGTDRSARDQLDRMPVTRCRMCIPVRD